MHETRMAARPPMPRWRTGARSVRTRIPLLPEAKCLTVAPELTWHGLAPPSALAHEVVQV